MRTNKVI